MFNGKDIAKQSEFQGLQSTDGRSNPGRLRITDVNKDGYPDIVVTGSFTNDKTAFSLT